MLKIGTLTNRSAETRWTAREFAAFRAAGLADYTDEDFEIQLTAIQNYYAASLVLLQPFWRAKGQEDFRRHTLLAVLENWGGELDRAKGWAHFNKNYREAGGPNAYLP